MLADILVELSGKLLAGSVDATLHRADCTAEFIRRIVVRATLDHHIFQYRSIGLG